MISSMGIRIADLLLAARRWALGFGRQALHAEPHACWISAGCMMMAARQSVRDADRRFPVRTRIGVPPQGLGDRIDQIGAWLDANAVLIW